jgi:cystathionine beta-lyase/cystathionine gamma-synthase
MQTATKYIGGHSDTLGGVLTGTAVMMRKIFLSEYLCAGNGIQPFNAWLLLRGLRTLPARLDRITRSTLKVLDYLKTVPQVESLIFPLDPSFPQYELAKRQMKGASGLISFYIKADNIEKIEKFCNGLKAFRMAVSWGGHESLVIPKCAGMKREAFDSTNPTHRLIRLYIGLEEPEFLIADLSNSFNGI